MGATGPALVRGMMYRAETLQPPSLFFFARVETLCVQRLHRSCAGEESYDPGCRSPSLGRVLFCGVFVWVFGWCFPVLFWFSFFELAEFLPQRCPNESDRLLEK